MYKLLILLLSLIPVMRIQGQDSNPYLKYGSLLMSVGASYLEATKEQDQTNEFLAMKYHELKYLSTLGYSGSAFMFGLDFSADRKDGKYQWAKYLRRAVGMILIDWVVWELRYSQLDRSDRTYSGWPFDGSFVRGKHNILFWNVARLAVGLYLYIME